MVAIPIKKLFRKSLKWITMVTAIALLPTLAIILHRTWFIPHAVQVPLSIPADDIVPEKQVESHTCGMHALHTIYRAYGVKPELENIRSRLGVDYYALVWLRSSTGTFQADIKMVLEQDYFEVSHAHNPELLKAHLAAGHLAAMLIRRPETGGLHWIVVSPDSPSTPDRLLVIDPLKQTPGATTIQELYESSFVSAMLIKPATGKRSFLYPIASLLSGALEMIRSLPNM